MPKEVEINLDLQRAAIKEHLKEKGWTYATLSRLTGYPRPDVTNIMNGKMKGTPYVSTFITTVCEAYGIKAGGQK